MYKVILIYEEEEGRGSNLEPQEKLPSKNPALLELTCDSEKVLYLLKYKVCGEILFVAKEKNKFRYGFTNYKSENRAFGKSNRKVSQKLFYFHYCPNGQVTL